MDSNVQILKEWQNSISGFEQLSFSEARELYISYQLDYDKNKRTRLINGTLYIIYKFIKQNLLFLTSSAYDMDDIINTCVELWISRIDAGDLLKVSSFSYITHRKFYYDLSDMLIGDKYLIYENLAIDGESFVKILADFITHRNKNKKFTYNDFLKLIETDYNQFLYSPYGYENRLSDTYKLLDAIYNYLSDCLDDINMSTSKIENIKYILINNGLEHLKVPLDNVFSQDVATVIDHRIYVKDIIDFIFSSTELDEKQKDSIKYKYDIDQDGEEDRQIATNLTLIKEVRILRKIRSIKGIKKKVLF